MPASPALGEQPSFREHIKHEDDWHVVDDVTAMCGFEVLHREQVNVVIRGFADRTETNVSGRTEFTTTTGDEVLTSRFSHHTTTIEQTATDGDTEVITSERTFRGLPAMWSKPGEGVLWKDAGFAHFTATATIDVSGPTPQLVDFSLEVHDLHGPHPELEMTDEEFFANVCSALREGDDRTQPRAR